MERKLHWQHIRKPLQLRARQPRNIIRHHGRREKLQSVFRRTGKRPLQNPFWRSRHNKKNRSQHIPFVSRIRLLHQGGRNLRHTGTILARRHQHKLKHCRGNISGTCEKLSHRTCGKFQAAAETQNEKTPGRSRTDIQVREDKGKRKRI